MFAPKKANNMQPRIGLPPGPTKGEETPTLATLQEKTKKGNGEQARRVKSHLRPIKGTANRHNGSVTTVP